MVGEIDSSHNCEDLVRGVAHFGSFSKIAQDPVHGFLLFCIKNQLFQVKAHPLAPARWPGKFSLGSNLPIEVLIMSAKFVHLINMACSDK